MTSPSIATSRQHVTTCPFCSGASLDVFDGLLIRRVRCRSCEAMGPAVDRKATDAVALAAWNKRERPEKVVGQVNSEGRGS